MFVYSRVSQRGWFYPPVGVRGMEGGTETKILKAPGNRSQTAMSRSDIDIGYRSDISQKANIGFYRTASKISDISAPI